MGFWDRIRDWFGRESANEPALKEPPTKPRPGTTPVVKPSDDDTVPLPGGAAVDIFRLLFSNRDKYTATMLNSISLSPDMKTLYLIDNNRAIPFDLTVPQGVLVGLLGNQLVVATARSLPVPSDMPTDTPSDPDGGNVVSDATGDRTSTDTPISPISEKYTFKAGENSQYTLSYNSKNKALAVIGVGDIVIHLEAPEDAECNDKVFSLADKQVVNIRWAEEELRLTQIDGKG